MHTPLPSRALLRAIANTYSDFYARAGKHVSLELADSQHKAYAAALKSAGLAVDVISADDRHPDCVFIEDTAVVWSDAALIARMPSDREGEEPAVEAALRPSHRIVHLPPDAFLEGGDVLHADGITFVGLSHRTNSRGAEALAAFLTEFGRPVVPVPVQKSLHLKTAVTYVGFDTLIATSGLLDMSHFTHYTVLFTDPAETAAANCVRVRDQLLVPAGCPRTADRLSKFASEHGLRLRVIDISEFEKGEGSLTCLSLLF